MSFPSTFVDIQDAVIAKCRMQASTDRDRIKDWINQAYIRAVARTMEDIVLCHMDLTAGVHTYTLPAGVIEIRQIVSSQVNSTALTPPLTPISLEEILIRLADNSSTVSQSGTVTHYSQSGEDMFEVWPVPSNPDRLWIYYLEQPTALSADADVPRLPEPWATDVLEYGASMKAAEFKGDQNAQYYRQLYETSVKELQAHLNRKKGATTEQFLLARPTRVVPHDPSADIRGQR